MVKPKFNWSLIANDEDFHEFTGTLLLQVVSKNVYVSGRAGRDYGIDSSFEGNFDSDSGKWVFQDKFYGNLANLKAKLTGPKGKKGGKGKKSGNSEKGEVELILERLNALAGTKEHGLWHGTSQYRLLTNLKLLPQERQDLLTILDPVAQKGVKVDIWDGQKIELLANGNDFIMQQFFGEEPPLFLPFRDFRLQQGLLPLGDYFSAISYLDIGVQTALDTFLKSKESILLLKGTGGIGKTRTLLELGARICQDPAWEVFCTQEGTDSFDSHLGEIQLKHQNLIFVDDADRFQHLPKLLRAMTMHPRFRGRMKVILACRGAVARPVEMEVQTVAGASITTLDLSNSRQDLAAIARELGHIDEESQTLSRLAAGIPLWIILGSVALKNGIALRDLTRERTIEFHLNRYLSEVAPENSETRRSFLAVLAALEPINIEAGPTREAVAKLVGVPIPEVIQYVHEVRRAGFIERRGRFLRLTPDLVSDFVLSRALFAGGIPTDFQKGLLSGYVPDMRRLIGNLARAEWISGRPVLDDIVQKSIQGAAAKDNRERLSWLETFGALAYVRPREYLDIVQRFLDSPMPNVKRDVIIALGEKYEWHRHQDVVDAIPKTLRGVLRWREHRTAALEVLARIAEVQQGQELYEPGAAQVFSDALKLGLRVPVVFIEDGLRLAARWQSDDKHLPLIVSAVTNVLSVEFQDELLNDDAQLHVTIGRLPITDELKKFRTEALGIISELASAKDASRRIQALKVLLQAWRQARNGIDGEEKRLIITTSATSQEKLEEVTIPSINQKDYLWDQIDAFYRLVEQIETIESDPQVLAEVARFILWDAEHAPKDDPSRARAQTLHDKLYARPDFRLYAIVNHIGHNLEFLNALKEELLQKILTSGDPLTFFDIAQRALGDLSIPGTGVAGLLFDLTSKNPEFGQNVLDRVSKNTLSLHPTALGMVLAALRLVHGKVTILHAYGEKGGVWFEAVASAIPELCKGISNDKKWLTVWDMNVIGTLAEREFPAIRRMVAVFLRLIAPAYSEFTMRIVETLLRRPLVGELGESTAQAVLEICQSARGYRARAREVLDRFVREPNLGYWTQEAIMLVASSDPLWLVRFFEQRCLQLPANIDGVRADPVPWRVHPPLSQGESVDKSGLLAAAIEVLAWGRREDPLRIFKDDVLAWLLGTESEEILLPWLIQHVKQLNNIHDYQIVSDVARAIGPTDGILEIIGLALKQTTSLSAKDVSNVRQLMHQALPVGTMHSAFREIPPALITHKALLEKLGSMFSADNSVQQFVKEEIKTVEELIRAKLLHDEEIGIG